MARIELPHYTNHFLKVHNSKEWRSSYMLKSSVVLWCFGVTVTRLSTHGCTPGLSTNRTSSLCYNYVFLTIHKSKEWRSCYMLKSSLVFAPLPSPLHNSFEFIATFKQHSLLHYNSSIKRPQYSNRLQLYLEIWAKRQK